MDIYRQISLSDNIGNVDIPVTVVTKNHPVTASLHDFVLRDELYSNMHMVGNVTPLLKTGNEQVARCRMEKKSRVVGTILGHGCYTDTNFRHSSRKASVGWRRDNP